MHCCGFDSIPSDMGVHFLQRQAMKRLGAPCTRVKMRVKAMRGGFSGGTVASLMNVVKEAAADPALRKELADPYSLCPAGSAPNVRQPDVRSAEFDVDFDAWVAPFVMSAINTRIVQRTQRAVGPGLWRRLHLRRGHADGPRTEGPDRCHRHGRRASTASCSRVPSVRRARHLSASCCPSPARARAPRRSARGFFDLRFVGTTADGRQIRTKVTGDRDPGYGSTGKMLGQAAACLALDVDKAATPGGFWTPATIFGDRLIQRLTAHSGLTFELVPD